MRKLLFTFIIGAIIIPQFVLAAWWNPFSWKFFKKTDTKTKILENRVKELENKLDSVVNATTSPSTPEFPKIVAVATTSTKVEVKSTTKPKVVKIQTVKVTTPIKEVKTWTLPNGAVIDKAGNIVSPPVTQKSNTTITTKTEPPAKVFIDYSPQFIVESNKIYIQGVNSGCIDLNKILYSVRNLNGDIDTKFMFNKITHTTKDYSDSTCNPLGSSQMTPFTYGDEISFKTTTQLKGVYDITVTVMPVFNGFNGKEMEKLGGLPLHVMYEVK